MSFFVRKLFVPALFAFSFLSAAPAQQNWSPETQMKTKNITATQVSPDGKHILYTVNEAVMTPDKSEFLTQIWAAKTDGSNSFQVTFGDKSSTNPKWSPDGNWIAFTSTRKDNRNNLYLLRLNGGEAEPLTDLKGSVGDFNWSPDGKSIAYTMTDGKTDDEEKNDRGRNDYRWVDENLKMARLYVIPAAKDASGKREPRKLTTENYNVGGFDWSPDAKSIAFAYTKTSGTNDWVTSDASIIDLATGKLSVLANSPASEGGPAYSPDGKSIALTVSDNPPRWATNSTIRIFPAAGGTPKILADSFDGQPAIAGWSADNSKIYFSESKGTAIAMYAADVATNKIEEIKTSPALYLSISLNQAETMLGFVRQLPDAPPEVFVSPVTNFAPVQISHLNSEITKIPFGKTEVIRWKSKDGKEIEGLLTYPIGYRAGTKVPLILNIHGGPTQVFQQNFLGGRGVYPMATFASHGYAILRPNPRGSSGYGKEFRYANFKDWGGMDYQDVMTGVDKVIEMGVADPERLGVMGWSYGGYMTSWIVTQTHRFKAASAGAPVTDLVSFTGTSDITGFIPDYFGGQPWDNYELYMKHSAMFNVKGVTTPTMIQQGEADPRVPISQGYEFYNALKVQGVPVRMMVLPRQPHNPVEPKLQLAAAKANLEWFDKYLGGK